MLLIAGEYDKNGQLPPVETIAYDFGIMTKDALSKVDSTLTPLLQVGVIGKNLEGWFIVNWNKRQSPADPTAAERQKRHRERDITRDVTRIQPTSTSSSDSFSLNSDKQFSQIDTSVALSSFGDNRDHDSLKLYMLITGQSAPLSGKIDQTLADLSTILDHYKAIDAAVPDGKRVFARTYPGFFNSIDRQVKWQDRMSA